jgi:hypothetical protein
VAPSHAPPNGEETHDYGRFCRTELLRSLDPINECLMRLGHAQIQTTATPPRQGMGTRGRRETAQPDLFAHWHAGAQPQAG